MHFLGANNEDACDKAGKKSDQQASHKFIINSKWILGSIFLNKRLKKMNKQCFIVQFP
jgi:hypothetical protein